MTYIAPEESAFGVGFFERLEANAKPMSLTRGPDAWDVLESIKRNVSNILNTRLVERKVPLISGWWILMMQRWKP